MMLALHLVSIIIIIIIIIIAAARTVVINVDVKQMTHRTFNAVSSSHQFNGRLINIAQKLSNTEL